MHSDSKKWRVFLYAPATPLFAAGGVRRCKHYPPNFLSPTQRLARPPIPITIQPAYPTLREIELRLVARGHLAAGVLGPAVPRSFQPDPR